MVSQQKNQSPSTSSTSTTSSSYKQVQTLRDGTVRHTIATQSIPSFVVAPPQQEPAILYPPVTTTTDTDECLVFDAAATIFRTTTHQAIMAFTRQLSRSIELASSSSTATSSSGGDSDSRDTSFLQVVPDENDTNAFTTIDTFYDVVQNGVHLEHFHSYVLPTPDIASSQKPPSTLQLHTDQGLFLAFTPGRYATTGALTNGFYITLPSSDTTTTTVEVSFNNDDALIFMLGDGVNQYINPKLPPTAPKLRAVPHSLQLKASASESHHHPNNRIWYGVMILPPSNAIHPGHGDVTFGELRQGLVQDYESYVHLACSNADTAMTSGTAAQSYRQLQSDNTASESCNNVDEIYCWHRCMNVTEYDVSAEQCDETFRILSCINPREELWNGTLHGDYYPGCVDPATVMNETDVPKLPDFPRANENDVCNTNFQSKFNDGTYKNSIYLESGDGAIFQHTVVDGSTVMGRLIFNGIFGYLSIGFAGPGTSNFMANGRVMVATRGDEFSPRYGLDLTLPNVVQDYIIDPVETTFRIWGQQPYIAPTTEESTTLDFDDNNRRQLQKAYNVMTDDCYTILTFTTDTIADQAFNLQGSDTMIWAANNQDAYMQYHGSNRGIFTVDWTSVATTSPTTDTSSGVVHYVTTMVLIPFVAMTFVLTTISIVSFV